MDACPTSVFHLPDHLAAKADPALISADERHFSTVAESLRQSIADLSHRLEAERRAEPVRRRWTVIWRSTG